MDYKQFIGKNYKGFWFGSDEFFQKMRDEGYVKDHKNPLVFDVKDSFVLKLGEEHTVINNRFEDGDDGCTIIVNIIKQSEKAIQISIKGTKFMRRKQCDKGIESKFSLSHWIPKNQINSLDSDQLVISKWITEQKELQYFGEKETTIIDIRRRQ